MSIDIPAELVCSGAGVPGVCARHGDPAVLKKPVRFISKPPGWTMALILFGVLPYVIVVALLRKEAQAQAWPFCARCVQLHKKRTLLGLGLFLPLVLLFVLAFAAPNALGSAVAWVGLAAVFACVFGMGALARGSYRLLPQGQVSRDGRTVAFPKAHPNFVAAAQAAYQRAAQQYAATQAAYQAAYAPQHPPRA